MVLRMSSLLQLKDSLQDSMLIRGTVLNMESQYQIKELRDFGHFYGGFAPISGQNFSEILWKQEGLVTRATWKANVYCTALVN